MSIISAASVIVSPKIGLGITSSLLLSAVEKSSHGALNYLSKPSYQWRPDVQIVLVESDIVAKIQTVEALVQTIQRKRGIVSNSNENENNSSSRTDQEANSSSETTSSNGGDVIEVCLRNLQSILDEITATMKEVTNELESHELKWFSSYRTPNLQLPLQKLKSQSSILEKRLDMLIKCMSISE